MCFTGDNDDDDIENPASTPPPVTEFVKDSKTLNDNTSAMTTNDNDDANGYDKNNFGLTNDNTAIKNKEGFTPPTIETATTTALA